MTQLYASTGQTVSAAPEPSDEHNGSTATPTAESAAPQPGLTPTLPEYTPKLEPTPAPNAPNPVVAAPQEKEPQNALTEKFTEAEWKALKAFRVSSSRLPIHRPQLRFKLFLQSNLPETFKEAFPDQEDAGTVPYKIWGVTINPLASQDARVSVVLMKFLRARYISLSFPRMHTNPYID
jgi:hypothetical protein